MKRKEKLKEILLAAEFNDKVYSTNEYQNNYFKNPILGKTLEEVEFDKISFARNENGCVELKNLIPFDEVINGKNHFKRYTFMYKLHSINRISSSSIHLITKNDKIIYFKNSSYSDAGNHAFNLLSNTYQFYNQAENFCTTNDNVKRFHNLSWKKIRLVESIKKIDSVEKYFQDYTSHF